MGFQLGEKLKKLDEHTKTATGRLSDQVNNQLPNRLRATTANNEPGTTFQDRLKIARSGQSVTQVGARWDKDMADRRQVEAGAGNADEDIAGSSPGPLASPSLPTRRQPPNAAGYIGKPPPPPQRNGATTTSRPPAPARPAAAAAASARPPLPARTSTGGASPAPLAPPRPGSMPSPPPLLPPRMANQAGTANPPPPYRLQTDLADDLGGLSMGTSASAASSPLVPARRGPPPIPSSRKPLAVTSNPLQAAAPAPPSRPNAPPPRPATSSRMALASTSASPSLLLPALSASRSSLSKTCKALEAATFFCYPTHFPEWTSSPPWFASAGLQTVVMPPPLKTRSDLSWKAGLTSYGSTVEIKGGLQFDDLSTLWYCIRLANSLRLDQFESKAAYAEPPQPWTEESHPGLLEANADSYGEMLARKGEEWEGSVVGDGECWTLIHQAILNVNGEQGYSKDQTLFESVGRTHGHLLYHGRAEQSNGKTRRGGVWRGGDLGNVRRGDVLEWGPSEFKVPTALSGGRTSTTTLKLGAPERNSPDHTALVIGVTPPSLTQSTGEEHDLDLPQGQQVLSPHRLGSITVLEQAAGQTVHRTTYQFDLTGEGQGWTQGELWIFRPVGAQALLEGEVEVDSWDAATNRRRGWEALN